MSKSRGLKESLKWPRSLLVILPTALRCLRPRHENFVHKFSEVFVAGGAIVFIIEDISLDFRMCLFRLFSRQKLRFGRSNSHRSFPPLGLFRLVNVAQEFHC